MSPKTLCLALLWLALLLSMISGCASEAATESRAYCYVIDNSASTADMRRLEIGAMLAELECAPPGSFVTVYRMGSRTEEVYSGQIDETGTDTIVAAVMRDASVSDPVPGTNFAAMAEALRSFELRCPAKSLFLRVLTDGADDYAADPALHSTYLKGAEASASDERVASIAFYGVKAGFRDDLKAAFLAAGSKLSILTRDQLIGG